MAFLAFLNLLNVIGMGRGEVAGEKGEREGVSEVVEHDPVDSQEHDLPVAEGRKDGPQSWGVGYLG